MAFSIKFDYRFDSNGFFDDPDARAALEAAGAAWEAVILDDFAEVPAGIQYAISNPSTGATETITLTEATDDLVIYVGSRNLPGSTLGTAGPSGYSAQGDFFSARISSNFRGQGPVTDFEPWAGTMYFDTGANWNFDLAGAVSGKSDFISVAMHEIGHVLGFGTSAAFDAFVVGEDFIGPNAMAANGGDPVPLHHDHSHVEEGFDGNSVLLDPTITQGTRVGISDIDKAMLADIGYQIAGFTAQGSQPDITTNGNDQTVFGTIIGDEIDGLAGNDWIQAGSGDDTIAGGAGNDTLFGQGGDDTFVLRPGDDQNVLYDFDLGDDKIRLIDSEFSTLSEVVASLSRPQFSNVVRVDIFDGSYLDVFLDNSSQQLTEAHFELFSTSSNAAPTGNVTISGTATQGQTLSVSTSGVSDADGLGAFTHQWLRDGVSIAGATASSFVLTQADVGHAISVRSQYVDGGGTTETLTSAATSAVQNVNDLPGGQVTLSGQMQENKTIEADTSALSDADGLGSFAYLWFRDGSATGITTKSYLLGDADVGAEMSVRVRYTDGHGTLETLFSAPSAPIQNVNDAPQGAVTISGTAQEDAVLTAVSSLSDNDGLGPFSYQWLRDGVGISGATAQTYTLGQEDVGARISVQISYTDGQGTPESVTSSQTLSVQNLNDLPEGTVSLSGTAEEDAQLSALVAGLSDEDGLGPFSFAWLRDGVAINGASGQQYTLTQSDVGARISVEVSYTDGEGTQESVTSAESATVENVNDPPTGTVSVSGTTTEGQTLTASAGSLQDEDGLGALVFTWLRDGSSTGVTGTTYLLGAGDIGAKMSVRVEYTDGAGTNETVTSAQTATVQNDNDPPTGGVTLSGTPTQGQSLTAHTDTLADADGLGALTFAWLRDGLQIGGASGSSYQLGQDDVGAAISVRVTYTDGQGTPESVTSAATAQIANINDLPTGVPAVIGTPTQGETLTVDTQDIADPDGLGAFLYQWLRDGIAISGATGASYDLAQDDVAAQISVRVSFTDGEGTAEALTSGATPAVQNINDAPTGQVSLSGVPRQGETLTASAGTLADPDGLGALSFQWLRNGQEISGQTGATLLLTQDEVGQQISVRVSYTDGGGALETVVSSATGAIQDVNDPPAGAVSVAGTAQQGETLTAETGTIADPDGLGAFSYTWLRDGALISGATLQSYDLQQADVGAAITVRVSYTDGQGNAEQLTSGPTATVQNTNDLPTGAVDISGATTEGATLTANPGALADPDGLGAFSFQWLLDGSATGATGQTYALQAADIGARMSVTVSYTDGFGQSESVTSAETSVVTNVNDAPTGGISISGSRIEGETLSAVTSALQDADGLGAFSYQWFRDGAFIPGASGATLLLDQEDVGAAIALRVRYTDGFGTVETVFSPATGPIENVNDPATGSISILGSPVERQILQAQHSGVADGDGLGAFTFQWLRDGTPIAGASGAFYELSAADVGSGISVELRFVDGEGTLETLQSGVTAAVQGNAAPTGAALINGSAAEGQTLTLDTSTLDDPDGLGPLSIIWLRDGSPISGAFGTSYELDQADVGGRISAQVSFVDGLGQQEIVTTAETTPVQNVNGAPQGAVTLQGIPQEGQVLRPGISTLSDPDGLGDLSFTWLRDGLAFGATGPSYLLKDADVGAQLSVRVTYTDGEGTFEQLTSPQSTLVENVNDTPTGGVSITGTPAEGATLQAETGALQDEDGLGALQLTWLRDGAAFGATGPAYTLQAEDIGSRISLQVDYVDGFGTVERVTSPQTERIENVNAPPEGGVAITGNPIEGGTLLADASGLQDADGLGDLAFDWLRDGQETGQTGTAYLLGDDDVGERISVRVSYEDAQGTLETVTSARTNPVANVNDPPTGAVVVLGAPTEGSTLTADTSALADADGLGTINVTWLRDGVALGATGETYVLRAADIGTEISARIQYTDGQGTTETLVSEPTEPVQNINDAPLGAVAITGTAREGNVLRAVTNSISDGDGLGAFNLVWLRDGQETGVAGDRYTLDDADVGARLTVRLTYVDGHGTEETLLSPATAAVQNVNDTPAGGVSILGTPTRGERLTADTTTLEDGDGLGAFAYAWLRDGQVISGATGAHYLLGPEDVGANIGLRVSYTDGGGRFETVQSAATAEVTNANKAPTGQVTLLGLAQEFETLTAETGSLADADGLGTLSYVWLRDGAPVSGANGASYALQQADVGAQISVQVSYQDGGGTQEIITSAETAPVENVNGAATGQVLVLGSLRQGSTLTALASDVDDTDGVGPLQFEWLRDGVEIAGATSSRYKLTQEDVDASIAARVRFVDGAGTPEALTSAGTRAIQNLNDTVEGSVRIEGTPAEGAALVVDTSALSDPDGLGPFQYTWLRDGKATGETEATYLLQAADIGARLSVRVHFEDGFGSRESVISPQTGIVQNTNDAPAGTLVISGLAREGDVLTVETNGISDADGLGPFQFQWLRDGVALPGAVSASYLLKAEDIGAAISLRLNYVDGFGTLETLTAAGTDIVISRDDLLIGDAGDQYLNGGPGNDTLSGGAGKDTLEGGSGSDVFDVNPGDQSVEIADFELGQDTLDLSDFDRADALGAVFNAEKGSAILRFADDTFLRVAGPGVSPETLSFDDILLAEGNLEPEGEVSLSGKTVVGNVLTLDAADVTDGDGILTGTIRFEWLRDGVPVEGADAPSYLLSEVDLGHVIQGALHYEDTFGTAEHVISDPTATILPQGKTKSGTDTLDFLDGTDGPDVLGANGGDDTITGGTGDDEIDGGEGVDTAAYSGSQSHYSLRLSPQGPVLTDRRGDGDGTDVLRNVELLDFAEELPLFGDRPMDLRMFGGTAGLSEEALEGFIEMYIAYFNRAPDAIGLFFWATALANGTSKETIAELFFDQDETRSLYGEEITDVTAFVQEVYDNVLGRAFDEAGLKFWVSVLEKGDVSLPTFMLEVIKGAKAPAPEDATQAFKDQKADDVAYLGNKSDLGIYFSAVKGMSDVENARAALADYDGSQQSVSDAKDRIDAFFADAADAQNGEFLMSVVGVVDNPFDLM